MAPGRPTRPALLAAAAAAAVPRAALAAGSAGAWLAERLPEPLLRPGPGGLRAWQWLAVPFALAAAWGLGSLLGWLTRRLLGRVVARTEVTWDDELLARLQGPLAAVWAVVALWLVVPSLDLPRAHDERIGHLLRGLGWFAVFWALSRAARVGFERARGAAAARGSLGLAGMLPLAQKAAQAVLLGLGAVALLNELGFQVASVLTGLGIGGLAVAFGAQKTIEHLFGSIAIGVDQPFRVGDVVNVEGVMGTVESIGARSTRIRTPDRTIVTFPNGKLAETRSESLTARDRLRLFAVLGLAYSTSAEQMRRVLAELEAALRAHPKIWPDAVVVRFASFGESSLNVEVVAWFQTTDWNEFTAIRQEILLRFMEIVERAGTSFAFPTRTVHLVDGRGPRPPPDGEGGRA